MRIKQWVSMCWVPSSGLVQQDAAMKDTDCILEAHCAVTQAYSHGERRKSSKEQAWAQQWQVFFPCRMSLGFSA